MDRLQLREAWGHRGAAREPAAVTASPGRHRRGIEQATLLLHLQAEAVTPPSVPRQPMPLASLSTEAGPGGCLGMTFCPISPRGYLALHPSYTPSHPPHPF